MFDNTKTNGYKWKLILIPSVILIIAISVFFHNPNPTDAKSFANPHANVLANTDNCATCHSTHSALTSTLLKQTDQTMLCFTCHDGLGSNLNVKATYTTVSQSVYESVYGTVYESVYDLSSFHPIKFDAYNKGSNNYVNASTMVAPFNQENNEHSALECTDCHTELHSNNSKLLVALPTASNATCLLCHKKSVYEDVGGAGSEGSRFNGNLYFALDAPRYDEPHNPDILDPLHPVHADAGIKCNDCHGGNTPGFLHGTKSTYKSVLRTKAAPFTSSASIQRFLLGSRGNITGWKDEGHVVTCYTSGCH